jgi:hypothetical protein
MDIGQIDLGITLKTFKSFGSEDKVSILMPTYYQPRLGG